MSLNIVDVVVVAFWRSRLQWVRERKRMRERWIDKCKGLLTLKDVAKPETYSKWFGFYMTCSIVYID